MFIFVTIKDYTVCCTFLNCRVLGLPLTKKAFTSTAVFPIYVCTHIVIDCRYPLATTLSFLLLFVQKREKIKSAKKRNGKKYKTQKSVFASPLLTAQSHTLHCNHFVFCSLVCPNRGSHFALTSDMTLCPYWDSDVDEEDELDKKKIDIFHLIIAYNF